MTDKQRKFCNEYLTDFNATQAAIRAGYSKKTARSLGAENLTKPDIQEYISECQKESQNRTQIKQDEIIKELKKIGFADIDMECLRPADKIKALEVMAKMLGLDKPDGDSDAENKVADMLINIFGGDV